MKCVDGLMRSGAVICLLTAAACTTTGDRSGFSRNLATIECPSNAVLMCENSHRGRECGCVEHSLIWKRPGFAEL
ncbi:MAG TPA: hypothetical protein VGC50_03745 [Gammaproteobacteria bacterium]